VIFILKIYILSLKIKENAQISAEIHKLKTKSSLPDNKLGITAWSIPIEAAILLI